MGAGRPPGPEDDGLHEPDELRGSRPESVGDGGDMPLVYPAPSVRNFRGRRGKLAWWRTEAPSTEG